MSKLRLLKVLVQPVFVLDDGDSLIEQPADAFTVAAGAWREFADEGGQFDQAVASLAAQVETDVEPPAPKPKHNGRVTTSRKR